MCECYDPKGPKYCNLHKEMSNNSKTGLESILNYNTKEANNYNKK